MARSGRPPKPSVLKLLAGNPGKRKVNKREPKMAGGTITPPSWLGRVAKLEWKRVLKAAPLGLITQGDRQLFAQYCQNTARIAELEKIVTEQGYTFVTEKGYVAQRPEIAMLKGLQHLQVRICAELGLSPSSRSRIELAPDNPLAKSDPAEDLLFGKRRSS